MKSGIFTDMPRTIFNVYFKTSNTRKYYGSLKAIFSDHKNEGIGISVHTLYQRNDEAWQLPYENEKVKIERGELLTTGDVKRK